MTVMRSKLSSPPASASNETAKRSNGQDFRGHGHGGGGNGGDSDGGGLPLQGSKGAHISVVDVDPPPSVIGGHPGRGRVSTGGRCMSGGVKVRE